MSLFTLRQHVNTLAPLDGGSVWVVLHNLGKVRRAEHGRRPEGRGRGGEGVRGARGHASVLQ